MSTASIFSDFWNNLVEHDEQGLFLAPRPNRAKVVFSTVVMKKTTFA